MTDIQLATKIDLDGKVDDSRVLTDVPANAKFTDTVYTHPTSHPASMITGLPTSLPANGGDSDTVGGFTVGMNVPAGSKLTDTITTVNGKTGVISKADIVALGIPEQDTIYTHPSSHAASMITGLDAVATSGDYNDLSNKPTIPTMPTLLSQLSNDSNFIDGAYDNTESGLAATTIQEAIDELKNLIDGLVNGD